MDNFKETLISIDSDKFSLEQLVSILLLIVSKISINTVSGMARSEGKTPKGISGSNRYRKIMVGCQKMVVRGLAGSEIPF